ncbi:MAG: CPBP family intramembrane glutamic endopeptidase [Bacteroidales bacterium]
MLHMRDHGILGGLHPLIKLLLLVLVMLASTLVVFLIGFLIALPFWGEGLLQGMDMTGVDDLNLIRYLQLLSHIGMFIVSSLVFGLLVGGRPLHYLQADKQPSVRALLLSVLIMLAALPLINYVMEINQQMSLPESLRKLEEWMRQTEDAAQVMTERFLQVTTYQGLLFNIFLIAIVPAIGEEFIFRGSLQRVFHQWSRNVHVAVIVTALVFSAIHFQFYGFMPRFVLGLVLGYMMVITGNIWVPVLGHFFNNAAAVITYFIVYNYTERDPGEIGSQSFGVLLALISLAMVVVFLRMLSWYSGHNKPLQGGAESGLH